MAVSNPAGDEIQLAELEAVGTQLDDALASATVTFSAPKPAPSTAPTGSAPASAAPAAVPETAVQRARFAPLAEEPTVMSAPSNIDLLMDVSLRVSVELGRATLSVRETLNLAPGHVLELDKLAGDPVDILINGRLVARGEVVVVDDQFGVRVTEIVPARQRVEAIR